MKKKIFLYARLLTTAAIFFALFKFIPYEQLIEVYRNADKLYLVLAFFIFYCALSLCMVRWRFLLSSLGLIISFREVIYSYYSGLFLNLFFPSYIAGDIFRGFSLSYRHGSLKKVASSILMDRFSGVTALILLASTCFFFGTEILKDRIVIVTILTLGFLVGISFLIIFSKTLFLLLMNVFKDDSALKKKLVSFHGQLYFFRENPSVFIKALLLSFLSQFLLAWGFFIASLAFGSKINIIYFLILVPIILAIASIPLTIAGAGTREACTVYFFALVGMNKSIGLGIAFLNLIFLVSAGILGGLIYVGVYHRRLQLNT